MAGGAYHVRIVSDWQNYKQLEEMLEEACGEQAREGFRLVRTERILYSERTQAIILFFESA